MGLFDANLRTVKKLFEHAWRDLAQMAAESGYLYAPRARLAIDCMGFICDCEEDTGPDHGMTLSDTCPTATCYHCGWSGTFPPKPKGLQAWEKKALDAGWTMPEARAKELGVK